MKWGKMWYKAGKEGLPEARSDQSATALDRDNNKLCLQNERVTSTHDTRSETIGRARGIAQRERNEGVIHRPDGRMRDKDSYGYDPCPPRDRKQ
jgi:hypothetical protein